MAPHLAGLFILLIDRVARVLRLGGQVRPVAVAAVGHPDLLPQLHDLRLKHRHTTSRPRRFKRLAALRLQVDLIILLSHIREDPSHLLTRRSRVSFHCIGEPASTAVSSPD